ncbi:MULTISPECIES: cytochrome c maturation protein CcmE [Candidatus Accumulibacter]|uniref:Cytochrome c-type biogenesis protein CcmE n=2 Tax=Candidatus Accumulibacter TaxID=327159 RepID=A0A5S4F4G5_9PROT|nr:MULTISPECIES: cytochrome c maturation protein CcmE [Candidatus Accumulibacter]KFB66127.1 MAG: Heme chaperone CcmE [Candidatus Accumulibacter vicinus]TMQ75643.1 Cytochrome c-type biogenesis protein CcmE, heme chaperone [Candidatus Accumulibacter phosphatis]
MKPRHQRMALIVGGLAILGLVATLVLNAFQSNLVFFFSPTQVAAGEAPRGKSFRIGGMVKEGSLQRQPDGVTLRFVVTDTDRDMTVAYKGILPDLFREGKGVVAQGRLAEDGVFAATEVLAKHDENYMPPEAAKAVSDAHERAASHKAAAEATARTLKP